MAQDAPRCLAADQADRRERSSWLPVAALAQRARGLLAVAGRGALSAARHAWITGPHDWNSNGKSDR